jgi:hypothetical protein
VAVAEGFRCLCRITDNKAGVALRQVDREEVDLALYATDDAQRLTEVDLGVTWRMHQRHEHLALTLTGRKDIILHDRHAAGKVVLIAKALEDPLRAMTLLLRVLPVLLEDLIDVADKRIQLWSRRRLLAPIPRWYRKMKHLVHSPRINPEPTRRSALA